MQLQLVRPQLEAQFPGMEIHIACRDDLFYLLQGEDRILRQSEMKNRRSEFGYVRELATDMQSNPVEKLLDESHATVAPVRTSQGRAVRQCVLLTDAVLPNKNLSEKQIAAVTNHVGRKGGRLIINGDWKSADWVAGPENARLYQAAVAGKHVTLVPTGFGEKLFAKLFPQAEILRSPA